MNTKVSSISVCLLTYNHSAVIESTVQSILDQTIHDFEIVISDDCSTDGTWAVLERLARTDSRLRIIQTPVNRGMPGNANFAVLLCGGDYVALLHHDDIYRRDLLEKWSGVLDRNASVSFVFNPYANFGIDRIDEVPVPAECIDGKWLLETYLFPRWGCPIRGTVMIRRTTWGRVGGLRAEFGLLADVDLWMRLSMLGPVGYVPEPLITVRHDRPDDYPSIYKDSDWSWHRLVYLYALHGRNREDYYAGKPLRRIFEMYRFRLRLSLCTTKWIAYAIVRRKWDMLKTCDASKTHYDMILLRGFRTIVLRAARLLLK